jgi:hypothetical protein
MSTRYSPAEAEVKTRDNLERLPAYARVYIEMLERNNRELRRAVEPPAGDSLAHIQGRHVAGEFLPPIPLDPGDTFVFGDFWVRWQHRPAEERLGLSVNVAMGRLVILPSSTNAVLLRSTP